mmetsp:Transcript_24029/g.37432  ORF Transcript_24029/g.37432 Transcript_24029/m.37432 type:complete len:130 (-) Transcript_24029:116-505(-)
MQSAGKLNLRTGDRRYIGVIGDQDTITGLLLAGIGEGASMGQQSASNCVVIQKDTSREDALRAFMSLYDRKDIGIILINQFIANLIRDTIDNIERITPAVLEIPSHDHAYDFSKDSIMTRINKLLGDDL